MQLYTRHLILAAALITPLPHLNILHAVMVHILLKNILRIIGEGEGTAVSRGPGEGEGTAVSRGMGEGEGTAVSRGPGEGEGTAVSRGPGEGEGTAVSRGPGEGEGVLRGAEIRRSNSMRTGSLQ